MENFSTSSDGESIFFQDSGKNQTTLLFVHGWRGNGTWWDAQRDAFFDRYRIIQMDLAGHGRSSKNRKKWSVQSYAEDICSVISQSKAKEVILIGHSMSGSNVVAATHLCPEKIKKIVLVDTLHNVDQMLTMTEVAPLFEGLRKDYRGTIIHEFPNFAFSKTSPPAVMQRVIREISESEPQLSISNLEPFYSTDIRKACQKLEVPVRAIQTDLYPTEIASNRKHFKDYDCTIIPGFGHYPMLEAPDQFNSALSRFLG